MSDPADIAAQRVAQLRRLGRLDDAEREARTGLAVQPEHPGLLGGLAAVLLDAGRHADGLAAADAAVAATPEQEWPHRLRALLLSALGRHPEAVAAARRSVELAPDEPRAAIGGSMVLLGAGWRQQARDEAGRAIRLDPELADAHFQYARACSATGDPTMARLAYQQVLRLEPDHAAARNNLAALDIGAARYREAWRGLLDAGALDPDLAVVRTNVRILLRRLCLRLACFLGAVVVAMLMLSGYRSGWPVRIVAAAALVAGSLICLVEARTVPATARPAIRATLHADRGLVLCFALLGVAALLDLVTLVTGLRGLIVGMAVIALVVVATRYTDRYGGT